MKRYTASDIWPTIQSAIRNAQKAGTRIPLKYPSFFDTTPGYYLEQALLDVEDRRDMVAHSDGNRMKFYDAQNPDVVLRDIDRDAYYTAVANLVLSCRSRDDFEREYNDYL